MPRNGSDIFYILPGTEGFPDTTIESEKYNNYIHDVRDDLNRPRPIVAGGTGANDADEALANLGAEKSTQRVDNYNTHLFLPGSFYSEIGATGAPPAPAGQTAAHKFVGIAMSSDTPATPPANLNVVIRAYNQSSTVVPGRTYIRERKGGGAWSAWSIDGTGVAGPVPPTDPSDGLLWFDSEGGHLYVWYRDVDSAQWVIASPFSDPAQFLLKAGDTMEGTLGLYAPPTADLHAANKQYVDDAITNRATPPFPTGTGMLFYMQTPPPGWTRAIGFNDRVLRICDGAISWGGSAGLSALAAQTTTGNHNLTATEQASMSVSGSFSGSGSGNVSMSGGGGSTWIPGAGGVGEGGGTVGGFVVGLDPVTLTANVSVSGGISGTASGSGGGHSHPINLNIAYTDVLLATKD